MAASGIRMGKVFVEIGADPSKLFGTLNRINKRIGRVGAAMQQVGARMAGVGVALAAPIGLATRHFASFDDAIRATAAVTGSLGSQGAAALAMLTDKARELGATTSFTAVQVADLMTTLGRAGFSATEITSMTESVLALARATGTDATVSAGIVSAALRQFGLDASQAARVSDVLTVAANATFNTVEDLGEALKYAGPVAASLGMSLEDTVAALGVLGNVGIQGSQAGTALRRIATIAAGSGDELKQLFGISNVDAQGNLKPLVQILDEINNATANMSVAERTEKMAKAFGLLGITSANVLSSTAGGVAGLADRLRDAEGAAIRTAQAMDSGLGGSLRILRSAAEGVALAIGDAIAPSLQYVTDGISLLLGGVRKWMGENESMVQLAGMVAASILGIGAAIYSVGTALSISSAALTVLMNPLVMIPALLAGAVAGIVALGGGVDSLAAMLGDIGNIARVAFGGIGEALADGDLAGAMDILMAALYAGWARGAEAIMAQVDAFVTIFQNTLTYVAMGALAAWDALVYGMLDAWDFMERRVRAGFIGVRSLFQSAEETAQQNEQLAAEFQGRQADRTEERQRRAAEREQGAQTLADEREERNRQRAARRSQESNAASQGVVSRGKAAKEKRVQNEQYADLLAEIQAASTMEQLQDLFGQYEALSQTGRLTPAQDANLEMALEDAQNRVTIGGGAAAAGGRGAPGDVQASANEAAASQAETVGTFSSVGFGGMGFGGNLQEKANELLAKIEQNTSEPGLVGA